MIHQLTHLLGYYRVQRQNKYNCLMDIAKQERNFYIYLLVIHIFTGTYSKIANKEQRL